MGEIDGAFVEGVAAMVALVTDAVAGSFARSSTYGIPARGYAMTAT